MSLLNLNILYNNLLSRIIFRPPSFFIQGFRFLFHFFLFISITTYSLSEVVFKDPDLTIFLYSVTGAMLLLDAILFILDTRYKNWLFIYIIEAFFLALLMYKVNSYLPLFMSLWLVFIFLSNVHLNYRSSLFHGLWILILWTGVCAYSPHLAVFDATFIWNAILISVASIISSGASYYWNLKDILSHLQPSHFKRKVKSLGLYLNSYLAHVDAEILRNYVNQSSRPVLVDINRLIMKLIQEMRSDQVPCDINFDCQFQSIQKITAYEYRLQKSLSGLIHYLTFHSITPGIEKNLEDVSYKIETYSSQKYIIVKLTQFDVDFDLKHLASLKQQAQKTDKGILLLNKVIKEHDGYLNVDYLDNQIQITIRLPLNMDTNTPESIREGA